MADAAKLVQHPTDTDIWKSGMTRRGYAEAYRIQEKAAKIYTAREKTEAEMRAGGYSDRNPDRYNLPSDPATEQAFKMTKNRTFAANQAAQEEIARTAYRTFKSEGGFQSLRGREAAATFFNALGYNLSSFEAGKKYLFSPESEKRFS
jgi:hypothetical protein